jgi:hypothetical protein
MYKTKYWLSIYYLLHVSETYNTIMSLHALGISVDVHIRQLSVKKSCIIFLVEILLKKKEKNWYNCKNSEYLSVHGVMIYLFLLFSPRNINHFINFVWTSLFLQNKMLSLFIMTYRWSVKKTANPHNPQIYFYSCKFSYLKFEPDETDAIFKLIKS